MMHKLFVINTLSGFFRPRYLAQFYCATGLARLSNSRNFALNELKQMELL